MRSCVCWLDAALFGFDLLQSWLVVWFDLDLGRPF